MRIAVGSADGYPAIWRNTGGGWSLVTQPGQFGNTGGLGGLTGIVHGRAGWLAVGPNLILTSPDGVTWHAAGGTAALAAADLLAAAAGHGGYVIAGQQGMWFSPDLANWTKASGIDGTGQVLDVAADAHGFVAVGSVGGQRTSGQSAVWRSPDGQTWTRTGLSPAGATLRLVAAAGERVVVMGANAAGAPLAMRSVNGSATWQPVALPSAGPGTVVTALTADGAGFTATGESGTPGDQQLVAWTSPDGATWTRTALGTPGGTRTITALSAPATPTTPTTPTPTTSATPAAGVTGIGQIATEQSQQLVTWTPTR
jgi:hypothetical protein